MKVGKHSRDQISAALDYSGIVSAVFANPLPETRHTPEPVDETPNPLEDVDYTGDPQVDTVAEASAILTAFRERGKQEKATYKNATDSEFWFAICFRTRPQKDAFLEAVGWSLIGDKYLDGHILALLMGIELPDDLPFLKRKPRIDKRLNALAFEDGE